MAFDELTVMAPLFGTAPDPNGEMQQAVETVTVDPDIGRYCVALAAATRAHHQTLVGSSPRGGLALMLVARAYAVIDGRDFGDALGGREI